jgi:hypothetical protein
LTVQKRKNQQEEERGGGLENERESRILLTRKVMQQGPAIKLR